MFVNKNAHSHKCLLHNLYNQKTVTFLKSVIYFKKGLKKPHHKDFKDIT